MYRTTALKFATAVAISLCTPFVSAQGIPVASIQSMTGTIAYAGFYFQNGIRLAVEQVNAQGGIHGRPIQLIEYDDASEKGQALNLANRAANRDRAVLVLGPSSTALTMAMAGLFNDKHVPSMGFAASDIILQSGPWTLMYRQGAQADIPVLVRHVLEHTPIRKVALVFDRTNDGMIDFKNFFRDPFVAGGGTIVAEEAVISNDTNFLPLATKIKAMDVDAVYLSTYTEQTGNIIVQLRQAGVPEHVRFLGPLSMTSPQFLAIAGKYAEGAMAATDYAAGIDRPLNRRFEADYQARYGTVADSYAAAGWSLAQVAIAALQEAGANPTRQSVRDAYMRLRDVPVVVGSGLWNQTDRKPNVGVVIVTVQNGKFVPAS